MTQEPQATSRFSVNGVKLIIGLSVFALLMSLTGLLLVALMDNKQMPLKMMLFGFWGQIFTGVGYLYALAEKHLTSLVVYKKIILGLFIGGSIAGGWFSWDFGSKRYAPGVVVQDGKMPAPEIYFPEPDPLVIPEHLFHNDTLPFEGIVIPENLFRNDTLP